MDEVYVPVNGNGKNGSVHNSSPRAAGLANQIDPAEARYQDFKKLVSNAMYGQREFLRQLAAPRREIDKECGYDVAITPQFLCDLYSRDPIAARIVELWPLECWQVTPEVFETEDSTEATPFERGWDNVGNKLSGTKSWYQDEKGSPVWSYLQRVDVLSRKGSFGIVLIGINDRRPLDVPAEGAPKDGFVLDAVGTRAAATFTQSDTRAVPHAPPPPTSQLSVPWSKKYRDQLYAAIGTDALYFQDQFPNQTGVMQGGEGVAGSGEEQTKTESGGKYDLVFLRAFDQSLVQVATYESDLSNPRYGQPVYYLVTMNDPRQPQTGVGQPSQTLRVHWSRVIHVSDLTTAATNNEFFSEPAVQTSVNDLLDIKKILAASGEAFWRGCFMGMSLETNPQLGGDVQVDAEAMKEMMFNYQESFQKYLLLSGMSAKTLAPMVVDPTPHIMIRIQRICIDLACPQRVFMGSERGELASYQDDEAWNDRLTHRCNVYITPKIIAPFVDRLIMMKVLPEPKGYSVRWPDLESLSKLQKVQVASQVTGVLNQYSMGGISNLIAFPDFLTHILNFTEDQAAAFISNVERNIEDQGISTMAMRAAGGLPGILALIGQFNNHQIDKEQFMQIVEMFYGIDPTKAETLVPDQPPEPPQPQGPPPGPPQLPPKDAPHLTQVIQQFKEGKIDETEYKSILQKFFGMGEDEANQLIAGGQEGTQQEQQPQEEDQSQQEQVAPPEEGNLPIPESALPPAVRIARESLRQRESSQPQGETTDEEKERLMAEIAASILGENSPISNAAVPPKMDISAPKSAAIHLKAAHDAILKGDGATARKHMSAVKHHIAPIPKQKDPYAPVNKTTQIKDKKTGKVSGSAQGEEVSKAGKADAMPLLKMAMDRVVKSPKYIDPGKGLKDLVKQGTSGSYQSTTKSLASLGQGMHNDTLARLKTWSDANGGASITGKNLNGKAQATLASLWSNSPYETKLSKGYHDVYAGLTGPQRLEEAKRSASDWFDTMSQVPGGVEHITGGVSAPNKEAYIARVTAPDLVGADYYTSPLTSKAFAESKGVIWNQEYDDGLFDSILQDKLARLLYNEYDSKESLIAEIAVAVLNEKAVNNLFLVDNGGPGSGRKKGFQGFVSDAQRKWWFAKMGYQQVSAHINSLKQAGQATVRGSHKLLSGLADLTVKELNVLKKEHGIKASGVKADLVKKMRSKVKEALGQKGVQDTMAVPPPVDQPTKKGTKDGSESGEVQGKPSGTGRSVEGKAKGSSSSKPGKSGESPDLSSSEKAVKSSSSSDVKLSEISNRLNEYKKAFSKAGDHELADFVDSLKEHVKMVGQEAALEAMPKERGSAKGETVHYAASGGKDLAEHEEDSKWLHSYLSKVGITLTPDPNFKTVSSAPIAPTGKQGDVVPTKSNLTDKLSESKALPGLHTTEDLDKIMGVGGPESENGPAIKQLTPQVLKALDDKYGKDKWIIKPYGDEAFAGFGILFPDRVKEIQQSAREAVLKVSKGLAVSGYSIARAENGKSIGIKDASGKVLPFRSPELAKTSGEVQDLAHMASVYSTYEHGAVLSRTPEDSLRQASGVELSRDQNGQVTGITLPSGKHIGFSVLKEHDGVYGVDVSKSPEYDHFIQSGERDWLAHEVDRAVISAHDKSNVRYMAQPAFEAVGVSKEDRAAGMTWETSHEGRVHITTRNGKAEVIPYATLAHRSDSMPAVVYNKDIHDMEKAVENAINSLPASERNGQVYAPDVMKTKDGWRVVELNASTAESGSSLWLEANPMVIDAYVSHLAGRDPAHATFTRRVLQGKDVSDGPLGMPSKGKAGKRIQNNQAWNNLLEALSRSPSFNHFTQAARDARWAGHIKKEPVHKVYETQKPFIEQVPGLKDYGQPKKSKISAGKKTSDLLHTDVGAIAAATPSLLARVLGKVWGAVKDKLHSIAEAAGEYAQAEATGKLGMIGGKRDEPGAITEYGNYPVQVPISGLMKSKPIVTDPWAAEPKKQIIRELPSLFDPLQHISVAHQVLIKAGIESGLKHNLHTSVQLRGMAVHDPQKFDSVVAKLEANFIQANKAAYEKSLAATDADKITKYTAVKMQQLNKLRTDAAKWRAKNKPEDLTESDFELITPKTTQIVKGKKTQMKPDLKNVRGAGIVHISNAIDHLQEGGNISTAVAHVMETGGVSEQTAKRYVRAAVKKAANHIDDEVQGIKQKAEAIKKKMATNSLFGINLPELEEELAGLNMAKLQVQQMLNESEGWDDVSPASMREFINPEEYQSPESDGDDDESDDDDQDEFCPSDRVTEAARKPFESKGALINPSQPSFDERIVKNIQRGVLTENDFSQAARDARWAGHVKKGHQVHTRPPHPLHHNVAEIKKLGGGVNQTHMLTLVNGKKGVFKPGDGEEAGLRAEIPHGTYYKRETAASDVAGILGMRDMVPETITRKVHDREGSLQEFIPSATVADHVKNSYDGPHDLVRAAAFDYITGQTDRHPGNWMLTDKSTGIGARISKWLGNKIDGDKMKLIDNGLSFPTKESDHHFLNQDLVREVKDKPIPDMSAWKDKWPQVEHSLKANGVEGHAIDLAKRRFNALVSSSGKPFSSLPYGDKTLGEVTAKVPKGFRVIH